MKARGRSLVRAAVIAATASLAGALAGCGFRLEGRTVLPAALMRPYIDAPDQQSDFAQSLRRDLLISGARPTTGPDRASAVIHVMDDHVSRRVLSVSATNQPTEYLVTYTIRVTVSADGKQLLPPQQLTDTRSYSFDESLLLAKEHEEAILRGAMGRELAGIVMRRLGSL